MWNQLLAVFLVLALLLATLTLLRRKGFAQFRLAPFRLALRSQSAGRSREMQVLERIALGPQHSLHLIHVRDNLLLIGVGPSGCSKLDAFPKSAPPTELQESAR